MKYYSVKLTSKMSGVEVFIIGKNKAYIENKASKLINLMINYVLGEEMSLDRFERFENRLNNLSLEIGTCWCDRDDKIVQKENGRYRFNDIPLSVVYEESIRF